MANKSNGITCKSAIGNQPELRRKARVDYSLALALINPATRIDDESSHAADHSAGLAAADGDHNGLGIEFGQVRRSLLIAANLVVIQEVPPECLAFILIPVITTFEQALRCIH